MANELDDETVEAMMTATEEAYPIAPQVVRGEGAPARPRQARARRPVRADRRGARVLLARGGRHRRLVVRPLLAAARRDLPRLHRRRPRRRAAAATASRAGAYCTSVSKTILPYVLMNYTERLRDVSTLAHEFGHATHNVLALERADLALAPQRHPDGRGAVDVRAVDRRRLPARERDGSPARARRSPPTGSRTRSPRSTARRCSRASSSARTACAPKAARSARSG